MKNNQKKNKIRKKRKAKKKRENRKKETNTEIGSKESKTEEPGYESQPTICRKLKAKKEPWTLS